MALEFVNGWCMETTEQAHGEYYVLSTSLSVTSPARLAAFLHKIIFDTPERGIT